MNEYVDFFKIHHRIVGFFFFFLKTSTRNFTVKEKHGKVKAEGGFKQNLRVRGGNCSRIKAKAEV